MRKLILFSLLAVFLLEISLLAAGIPGATRVGWVSQAAVRPAAAMPNEICAEPHQDVAAPLNDLGVNSYQRMDGTMTGYQGGLYPGGVNSRPTGHEAGGLIQAGQIQALDLSGNPDPLNGKIGLISIGMSNTLMEFRVFRQLALADPAVYPQLIFINGAQAGVTAEQWIDPQAASWIETLRRVEELGLSAEQVQAAWVKLTLVGQGDFPQEAQLLQSYLELAAQNLLINFPNVKIAYFSSRTRSYLAWVGLDPEPSAYESGFAVKWLVEQQISGDPGLNYDPAQGLVAAPWIAWGPYLWADGENPRSDGLTWLQEDLVGDCVHPTDLGAAKAAALMLDFFKTDITSRSWFLAAPPRAYLPLTAFTRSAW